MFFCKGNKKVGSGQFAVCSAFALKIFRHELHQLTQIVLIIKIELSRILSVL